MSPRSVCIDLSGIGIQVNGVSSGVADGLREAWSGFVVPSVTDPALTVDVEDDPVLLAPVRNLAPSRVRHEGGDMHVAREEGKATIDAAAGRARVRLGSGDERRRVWGLVNLVNAALAFVLDRSGGGLLHAAGIVIEGRAFLLVGAEGAGKTTFARVASEAGHAVLSDDQVVLVSRAGRCEAVAAPIRNRDFPRVAPGRWPVGAFLLPRHGSSAALAPASRIDVAARLAANLLHVSAAPAGGSLDDLVDAVPGRWLTFAPEPSFLELLRAL